MFHCFSQQGDIGRVGYPGLRGEEGPIVSKIIIFQCINV